MKSIQRYCLYIDESGVPELSANTDFCILSGVLINEDDEKSFLFLIERIKRKYNLNLHKHIHAVDVFEKEKEKCFLGKTLRRPTKDLRKEFQSDIWNVIKDYSVDYFSVSVSKKDVKKIMGLNKRADKGRSWINSSNFYARVDRQLPMDIGANAIYYWAINKLSKIDRLKVIFEGRSGDLFTVRNFGYIQDKNVFQNKWMTHFSKKMKEQAVSIAFANKGVRSVGLELADIISYTCNIYFLQIKKKINPIDQSLKKAVCFKAIHKTLNSKHYIELSQQSIRKYFPGINSRTKRIAERYSRYSLSPANAEAQLNS